MFSHLYENKIFKILIIYLSSMLKGGVVFTVGLSLIAITMEITNSNSALLYYIIYIFVILGGFICGVAAHKKLKSRGFLDGIISSVPYSLFVFIVISALTNFSFNKSVILVFVLSVLGGFLGGITSANTRL